MATSHNAKITMTRKKENTGNKHHNRRRNIGRAILIALSVAGILSVALIAPNALQILTPGSGRRGRRMSMWEIERALDRLLNGGYVEKVQRRGNSFIQVTGEGKRKLIEIELQNARIKTPAKWDGRWRLVFFDIPHDERLTRDAMRRKLKELGFLQIQKSVYLHPYECYAIIQAMQDFYQIKPHFHYAVIEKIEHSKTYLKHFNLKPR